MNPTRCIFLLFVGAIAWIPTASFLGHLAVQDQDPAGKGIYSVLTTTFLIVVGALILGISAVNQARKHKERVHICVRMVAWLILLLPVLVAGGAILFELVGDMFR